MRLVQSGNERLNRKPFVCARQSCDAITVHGFEFNHDEWFDLCIVVFDSMGRCVNGLHGRPETKQPLNVAPVCFWLPLRDARANNKSGVREPLVDGVSQGLESDGKISWHSQLCLVYSI